MSNFSGIYCWRNKVTGKVLVGQSVNITKRQGEYLSLLRRDRYFHNRHLQRSWNKYGEESFEFIVLERVINPYFLTAYEQSYLDYYKTLPFGVYNQLGPVDTPTRGTTLSLEHKQKIAQSRIGRKFQPHTQQTRLKISSTKIGKKITQEHKDKISKARKAFEENRLNKQKVSNV